MKTEKHFPSSHPLFQQALFHIKDARMHGISSGNLGDLCEQGLIERLCRGIYRVVEASSGIDVEFEELILIASSIPNGVICLISALCYYRLTDQIMRNYWIAVPNTQKNPKRPHTKIVRMRNMTLGRITVKVGKYQVQIFDRERTIIDAFRYLSLEIALKALKAYLKYVPGKKPDLPKLSEYAKALRVNITPYIMALTT